MAGRHWGTGRERRDADRSWLTAVEDVVTDARQTGQSSWARARSLLEPALVVVTVAALVVGGIAWLLGWRAVADGCWVAGTLVRGRPRGGLGGRGAARGGPGVDLIAVLALVGTLCGGRVPGGCADRGDAGDRACAGRRRAAAGHAGSAGVAGAGAAHRAQAGRRRRLRGAGRRGRRRGSAWSSARVRCSPWTGWSRPVRRCWTSRR